MFDTAECVSPIHRLGFLAGNKWLNSLNTNKLFVSLYKAKSFQVPALLPTRCVTLGKSLSLSGPGDFHLAGEWAEVVVAGPALTFYDI